MEVPTTGSTFSEKDNKIDLVINSSSPKFEDLIDIKNYNITNIPKKNSKKHYKNQKKLKFCIKKIGHTLCFFSDNMGNPLIMIGPHWPMYVIFCGGVTIGYIAFFHAFFKKLNLFFKIFGITSFSTFFLSYSGTFFLNPGYPERNEYSLVGKPRMLYKNCPYCEIWERVDRKISHCMECGVCVEGHDHHCPWTGKCIGRKTINYFYVFITSVFINFFFFIAALISIDNKKGK